MIHKNNTWQEERKPIHNQIYIYEEINHAPMEFKQHHNYEIQAKSST